MTSATVSVSVKCDDAMRVPMDVLAVKFAQRPHGLDALLARAIADSGAPLVYPKPWDTWLSKDAPGVAASHVLFVGVPPLAEFRYREIRRFARLVMSALAQQAPQAAHVGLTTHGAGYGLDEAEAFESEIAGLLDAIRAGEMPNRLRRITVVESDPNRARRLSALLADLFPSGSIEAQKGSSSDIDHNSDERLRSVGYASEAKIRVFVAMPFDRAMEDVFEFGILGPARSAGCLCERADQAVFAGDVLEWVTARIKSASLVIADLSGANPNVFLEVGYAWGCGVPTVLLRREGDADVFDVRGQRQIRYDTIKNLAQQLSKELTALLEEMKT